MTRRSFFKYLGCLGALAVLPKAISAHVSEEHFRYYKDPYPLRFRYENGKYVQVDRFKNNGTKAAVNPEWVNAPYEAATEQMRFFVRDGANRN